mmetsp:Transcript_17359/g.44102  ORF Transcript_17359/g.44102 Transcript_17359/m.44102 type:complete len:561 (+) Transcript_17359:112-1794(+)
MPPPGPPCALSAPGAIAPSTCAPRWRAYCSRRVALGGLPPSRAVLIRRRAAVRVFAAQHSRAKAVDVLVVGSGLSGLVAAYRLAADGSQRKVALLDVSPPADFPRGTGRDRVARPFHLPHEEELNTYMAVEARALWAAVGRDADAQLLLPCGSLHMLLADPAATTREQVEQAGRRDLLEAKCSAAQIPFEVLAHDQVRSRFPVLRAAADSQTLFQASGGVLHVGTARRALGQLLAKAGVDVRRDRLAGWRDAGGFFQVRTADVQNAGSLQLPGDGAVIEAEQLVLAPGSAHAERVLRMFGLTGGLQRMGTVYGDWGAMSDMEKCPVVRVMHNDLAQPPSEDRPGLCLMPRLEGSRSAQVALSPVGRRVMSANEAERAQERLARQEEEEEDEGGELRTAGELASSARMDTEVAMSALTSTASKVTVGLDLESSPSRLGAASDITTADGFSLLGSHPGWDEGQVIVALPAATASGDGGAPLSSTLGLLAASAINGVACAYGSTSASRLAINRPSLEMQHANLQIDTWSELASLGAPKKPTSKRMVPTTRFKRADDNPRTYFM